MIDINRLIRDMSRFDLGLAEMSSRHTAFGQMRALHRPIGQMVRCDGAGSQCFGPNGTRSQVPGVHGLRRQLRPGHTAYRQLSGCHRQISELICRNTFRRQLQAGDCMVLKMRREDDANTQVLLPHRPRSDLAAVNGTRRQMPGLHDT
ncbi:hypothetical protein D3C81_1004410 [compost metagenome]